MRIADTALDQIFMNAHTANSFSDEAVPPEHYKAVAEIISYVFQLKNRTIPH